MLVKVKGKAIKLNGRWCYKGETEEITLEQYEGKEKYLEIVKADKEVKELPQVPGEDIVEEQSQEETEVDEEEIEKVEEENQQEEKQEETEVDEEEIEKVEEENQQEEKQEETEVDEELEALKEKAKSLDIKVTANMKKETIIKKIQEKEEDQNQTKNEE